MGKEGNGERASLRTSWHRWRGRGRAGGGESTEGGRRPEVGKTTAMAMTGVVRLDSNGEEERDVKAVLLGFSERRGTAGDQRGELEL